MTPEELQAFAPELTFQEAERCVWLMNSISEKANRPRQKGRVTKKARFQMPKWAWEQWRREFDRRER